MLEFNDTLTELNSGVQQPATAGRAFQGPAGCADGLDLNEDKLGSARVEELRHANWEKTGAGGFVACPTCRSMKRGVPPRGVVSNGTESGDAIVGQHYLGEEWATRCDNRPITYPGGVIKTNAQLRAERAAEEAAAQMRNTPP